MACPMPSTLSADCLSLVINRTIMYAAAVPAAVMNNVFIAFDVLSVSCRNEKIIPIVSIITGDSMPMNMAEQAEAVMRYHAFSADGRFVQ